MPEKALIPHLFRTEFSKITAVMCKAFGLAHIEVAEDIVSDTFLLAAETWGLKGLPENPTAWLYTVSKNKTKDYLKRNALFSQKIALELRYSSPVSEELEIDFSDENITNSQLRMMFAICHPSIPVEAQVGLSLRILCGFGIEEIADAFLSNKDTINKRLSRARSKLRNEKIEMEMPSSQEMDTRLEPVLTTLYLLFNEGYYSSVKETTLRKDLCLEAMRLTLLLVENNTTDKPFVNAFLSLMCFHASRFEARTHPDGELILYEDQDTQLWNQALVAQGEYYLNRASVGNEISKYHLEAAIAYWHTVPKDDPGKWENILQLYSQLLQLEYSPVAALNRTYALAMTAGKKVAIREAEKLTLKDNHLFHSLLANLYTGEDNTQALNHLKKALKLAKTEVEKGILQKRIALLET